MSTASGIGPFDARVGGLRDGGLYLLTGGAGAGKLTFLLQALDRGLRDGQRVALLSAADVEDVLEQAEFWGFDLASAWNDGRCVLLGFRGDFARRVLHAPDPREVFTELDRLLEGPVARLAIDPGSFLWETRAGAAMAQRFLDWIESLGTLTLATDTGNGASGGNPSSEWVRQRAHGVFHFARHPRGLHEVRVERCVPPVDESGPISLELTPGQGFTAPTGRLDRRRETARPASNRLLLLAVAGELPADIEAWLGRQHDVERAPDPLRCISRLREEEWGGLCVFTDRAHVSEAIHACRAARSVSPAAMLLLSDEPLRGADRARAIDAGCDDVLSGSLDVRELEARLRRAAAAAARPAAAEIERPEPSEAPLDASGFAHAVEERLRSDALVHFGLLHVPGGDEERFGQVLFGHVRAEDGDLVGRVRGGWGVLLQGARARQAESFLLRVREALAAEGATSDIEAEILASPEQSERIRAVLGD
ncbi:MAG: ATPase domain-containing protein [Gemmatimonadota bacterium]|nr:ATPase domain-containing protein [Gemmatimonadota bacterium]